MSKVTEETINKLAELAKLEFDENSKAQIQNDLNKMLAFVDKLNELDTEGLEPLIYMNNEQTILREDEVTSEITQDEALSNAPQKDSDYIKVPKVLDKEK
jgi:aspartyl-tRNA(Asn)/glutamyl-tRNA(Gln) amidotransferase subunit C